MPAVTRELQHVRVARECHIEVAARAYVQALRHFAAGERNSELPLPSSATLKLRAVASHVQFRTAREVRALFFYPRSHGATRTRR
jgi:hypothetical protein